jgi:hypothetical protein
MDARWQAGLKRWLVPFVAALGRKMRGRMCPAYIAGLIGPGDHKSVKPMAARDARSATISCATSSQAASGTPGRWRQRGAPCRDTDRGAMSSTANRDFHF